MVILKFLRVLLVANLVPFKQHGRGYFCQTIFERALLQRRGRGILLVMLILLLGVLLISFYLLAVVCDEFFVSSLDEIIDRLKMPSDVAGATFMAVGSSAPELFTSLIAVLRPGGVADVGAGTIVGSAIFNILVIIGASALFRQAKLNWQPVVRDSLFYALSILMLLWAFWDGRIYLMESVMFVGLYGVYLLAVVNWRKWFPYKEKDDVIEMVEKGLDPSSFGSRSGSRNAQDDKLDLFSLSSLSRKINKGAFRLLSLVIPDANKDKDKYLVTFGMSILLIAVLSWVLVESAVEIGHIVGISPVIISLTVLAAGTSIPDLLSSMAVAKKGRGDMAISNSVGSNIFDILFGLGVPWMIVLVFGRGDGYVSVATENLMSSIFLLFATLLSVFFLLAFREWKIGPKAGWLLIVIYLVYLGYNVVSVV